MGRKFESCALKMSAEVINPPRCVLMRFTRLCGRVRNVVKATKTAKKKKNYKQKGETSSVCFCGFYASRVSWTVPGGRRSRATSAFQVDCWWGGGQTRRVLNGSDAGRLTHITPRQRRCALQPQVPADLFELQRRKKKKKPQQSPPLPGNSQTHQWVMILIKIRTGCLFAFFFFFLREFFSWV